MPFDLRRPPLARLGCVLAIGWLAGSLAAAPAGADCPSSRGEAIAAARGMATALHEATTIPGLAIAVGSGDELLWSEGFGLADLETPAPVSSDTRFRAASVSKVLSVAVLARLAAREEIDLDAPIATYLPELPPALRVVSLRQLAGHLGGVRHYRREDFTPDPIDHRHFDSLGEALELFAADELEAPPGTEYHYSTFGYTLLGAALEAATGRSFSDLLAAEVARPLALSHTGLDDPQEIVAGRASLYDRSREGELVRAGYVDPSYKWPGGGLLTTPEDLVRFGQAHLGGEFLPAGMREQLFTPQATSDGTPTGVGLGWRIGEDWRGRRILHHSGSMAGARSSLLLYPDHDLVVALMSNLGGYPSQAETTLQMIAEPFLAGGDCVPEAELAPAGVFDLVVTLDGEAGDGVLLLTHRDGELGGLITTPAPVANELARGGAPASDALRIVGVAGGPGRPALVVAWPLGLLPLPFEVAGGGGLTARLEVAGRTLQFEARPLAARERMPALPR